MKRCTTFLAVMALLSCVLAARAAERLNYADRPEVRQFVTELAKEHNGLTEKQLLNAFAQAVYKQNIIDAISRPAEKTLEWDEYQDIFLTRKRVAQGVAFMSMYEEELEAANERFGVPGPIIAAVIGVETMYGRNRGSFRVLDALTTLAFDYPPRSRFFKRELRQFFLLAHEEGQQVTDLLGSYAGAMGYGQFIPSSYRHYAVDFDNDGVRDIWNNPADAIGSVANYLHEHGWRAGDAIILRAIVEEGVDDGMFDGSLKPSDTIGALAEKGIKTSVKLPVSEKVAPLRFEGKQGPEYWLGLENFYVITRYNHSKLYAMAVFQLSERLTGQWLANDSRP